MRQVGGEHAQQVAAVPRPRRPVVLDDRAQHVRGELLQLGRTGERPHQVRKRLPLRLLHRDTPHL